MKLRLAHWNQIAAYIKANDWGIGTDLESKLDADTSAPHECRCKKHEADKS